MPEPLFLSLVWLDFASVIEFASIDSGLCQQSPTNDAINAVVGLVNANHGVVCTATDVARLRTLAMLCGTCLPEAKMRQALALGAVPSATVVAGPPPARAYSRGWGTR